MKILNTKKNTRVEECTPAFEITPCSIVYVDQKWSCPNISDMYDKYCKEFSNNGKALDGNGKASCDISHPLTLTVNGQKTYPLTVTINGQKTYPTICVEGGKYIWNYSLKAVKNEDS
jgi:hypothetical protein